MKNLPVLSFLKNEWLLILLIAGAIWLAVDPRPFAHVGTIAYAPMLFLGAIGLGLFARNVINRSTGDPYVDNGTMKYDWENNTPALVKLIIVKVEFLVYFVVAGIIMAACINH